MERDVIENLIKWKDKIDRKPLVLRGARQVGKTWLMKYFGENYYDNYAYFNMDNDDILKGIFDKNYDTNRIIDELKLYSKVDIKKNKTLIIFDEIQEIPKTLTSLKYFCEENNEYHIICAGSLLGIALHKGTSFPVGKVEFENIFPLSFGEYLTAKGLREYRQIIDNKDYDKMKTFKSIYIDNLKEYYYIGVKVILANMQKTIWYYESKKCLILYQNNQATKIKNLCIAIYKKGQGQASMKKL